MPVHIPVARHGRPRLRRILALGLATPLFAGAAVAVGGSVSAQEAPAPVVVPCGLGAWLENGIRDSADVACLQTVLIAKGFNPGPIDSWFGPVTESAVRAFQASAGIVTDGEVGPETATALGTDMISAYTGAATDPSPDRVVVQQQRQRSSSNSNSSSSNSNRSSSSSSNSSSSSGGGGGGGGGGGNSGVNWDRVAQCESGGNWGYGQVTNSSGTFSGGLMIWNKAWTQFGGGEFAPTAGQATKAQQIIVAERIAAEVGAARAWQCPVG